MVSVLSVLNMKSFATVFAPGVAVTVIVVIALEARFNVAVTVVDPPFSEIDVLDNASVTVGAPSSSVIVNVTLAGAVMPWLFLCGRRYGHRFVRCVHIVIVRRNCHGAGARRLTGRNGQRLVATQHESPATAFVPGAADTVIVVIALEARFNVAVTVVDPPFSEIDVLDNASVTLGVPSSSVIVSVTLAGFGHALAVLRGRRYGHFLIRLRLHCYCSPKSLRCRCSSSDRLQWSACCCCST